ncbi:MAG: XkdF-like putative serine protease domain-containing protein [Alphaproteobacteria bacterium]|nr:XkdF-like putative serine protease domain-containing protein [Alphaproteobacteria bacterium]
MADFTTYAEVLKVDESLGLVFGWAIVCTEKGENYFDLQGDCIPEDAMLEAATDFAKSARASYEGHRRSDAGTVVHTFPLTADIAKSFGIECDRTGLMVAVQPDAVMLSKFRSGELTGFSIGGMRLVDEDVD